MDYEKLTAAVRLCGSEPSVKRCEKECAYYKGGDTRKCIPRMTKDAADAITVLLVENQALRNAANGFKDRAEKEEYRERQKCMRCRSKDPRELNSMKVLQYKFCPECGRDLRGGAV